MLTTDIETLLSQGEIISLSQGNILDKKQRFWGYFGIVVSLLFPIITLILLFIPQVEWDMQLISLMSVCNLGTLTFISFLAFIFIKNKKLVIKVRPWLEDAVEIKAISKKIGENRLGIQPRATKIQIKFTWNGIQHRKESTAKVFGGMEGYVSWFNKYVDKEIAILYSPKYDEVMIIKI